MLIPVILVSFFLLIALGFPIAISLGLSSIVALILYPEIPLIIVVQRLFVAVDSFPLMAVPLYMLAGFLMGSGGISRRIIDFSNSLVGGVTGGLAHVNILASMIFAGISGSAVADTAGIGNIIIPKMIEQKYSRSYSAAVTAISSTIGIVIPPSIPMVIIGSMLGVSVGKLFLGGIIPGLAMGFSLMFTAYLIAKKNKFGKSDQKIQLGKIAKSFIESFWSLLMPGIVIGGIVLGIFTPTEAGAVAVVYALIVGFLIYRELNLKYIIESLWMTVLGTAKVFFIIATAGLFTWLLTANGFHVLVGQLLLSISKSPTVLMAVMVLIILIITTFMESIATLILLLPILFPVAQQVGIDSIHFGVMIVISLGIGLVTPPVGLCLYVSADIAGVQIIEASKVLVPFILAIIAILAVLLIAPEIITILPKILMG